MAILGSPVFHPGSFGPAPTQLLEHLYSGFGPPLQHIQSFGPPANNEHQTGGMGGPMFHPQPGSFNMDHVAALIHALLGGNSGLGTHPVSVPGVSPGGINPGGPMIPAPTTSVAPGPFGHLGDGSGDPSHVLGLLSQAALRPADTLHEAGNNQQALQTWEAHHPGAMRTGQHIPGWVHQLLAAANNHGAGQSSTHAI